LVKVKPTPLAEKTNKQTKQAKQPNKSKTKEQHHHQQNNLPAFCETVFAMSMHTW